MSNVPISGLPAASSVDDTDLFAIVQIGTPNVTRQATGLQVRAPLLRLSGGTMTGDLTLTANFISQDSTLQNYFSVTPTPPTTINSGDNAMTVSNINTTSTGGSGTLSDVAFVMDHGGNPGFNGITTQMIYTYSGVTGSTAVTGAAAQIQAARQTATGGFNPTVEAANIFYFDQTGFKSSKTSTSRAVSITFEANDADDSKNRNLINLFLARYGGTGTDVTADAGIVIGGEASHHTYNNAISFTGSAAVACMNTTSSTEGASANTIWIAQGQHVAFDTANAGAAVSRLSSDGLTLNSASPVKPGVYTVATLPSVTGSNKGAMAFASNARNTGEGAGVGTGCVVVVNNAGTWISVWSGVAPTT